MRTLQSPALLVLALLVGGCDALSDDAFSAEDALALKAIDGEEEDAVRAQGDDTMERGEAPLPLFRECDAQGAFVDRFDEADADANGQLGPQEQGAVHDRHGPPPHHWHLLKIVYDLDESGDLSDTERATMLDDFSDRCEVLHERLLEEFDADGDGQLSEAEQQTARETLEARHEEMRENMPPPPHPPMDTDGGPPPRPEPGEIPPPLVDEFDADGSGDLDATELQALRDEIRERIRTGLPLGPPPPPPGEGPPPPMD